MNKYLRLYKFLWQTGLVAQCKNHYLKRMFFKGSEYDQEISQSQFAKMTQTTDIHNTIKVEEPEFPRQDSKLPIFHRLFDF